MTREAHSSGHWSGLLRDPVILATLVVHLALAFFTAVPVLGPYATSLVLESYALVPISILAVVAPWVALPRTRSSQETLFWALWSLSMAFHLAVRVTYLVVPDVDFITGGLGLVDVLYVLFYLALILSVLVRPDRPESSPEQEARGARALELAGTGVFIGALLAYFVIVPRSLNRPEYETWVPSLLMYWVLDAFLLYSLFHLRETALNRDWRILYTWLLVAPSCWVVTDMVELVFYLNWENESWNNGAADIVWYLPWIAIIVAGRMRNAPFPALFATGHREPDEAQMSRALGRPGWLLVAALVLPLVHFGANLLGILDPGTRDARELVVLASLALLLGMAAFHQKLLEGKTLELSRRSRALEERQRLLAAAVEQSPDAVLIADRDGVVSYGNRRYAALVGGLDGVVGASLLQALPGRLQGGDGGSWLRDVGECLATGRSWEGRTQPDPDGEVPEEMVTIAPVVDASGDVIHWILIRRDITYLSQLERRFRQAQRAETVGTLAGGLTRDFSDLLGEIYGRGEFLREQIPPTSPAHGELGSLLAATEKAAELVNQVRVFGEAEGERTVFSLGPLVRETLGLLKPTLPAQVRLLERIQEPGCRVEGVRHQLQQVVFNLVTNAIQAMESGGGTLEVSVEETEVGDREARALELKAPGAYVRVAVRDTGRGMDAATLEKVFDPYFTTKGMGAGTGLGLFLVRETVSGHGGGIRAESEVGWGTLFEVFLPCRQSEASGRSGPRGEER